MWKLYTLQAIILTPCIWPSNYTAKKPKVSKQSNWNTTQSSQGFLVALVPLAEANEKTHPLASLVWCQEHRMCKQRLRLCCEARVRALGCQMAWERLDTNTNTHTDTYLLFSSSSRDRRISRPELHRSATQLTWWERWPTPVASPTQAL